MNNEEKVLVVNDRPTVFKINFPNPYTGRNEVIPVAGTKKNATQRSVEISLDCYYYLKDQTTTFKEGYLRILTDKAPTARKEAQKDFEQQVLDTTPEYEQNSLSREDIAKIMKGKKVTIVKRLSEIENNDLKNFIVEVVKELDIKDIDKLRAVVEGLYGSEMEFDYIFPPTE